MSKELRREIIEYIIIIVVTVLLTNVFLHFVEISRVQGSSMEDTYHQGNILLVDKVFYDEDDAKYGDVITINSDVLNEKIIKRVIGLEGDHIQIIDNQLYRNGELVEEDYIKEPMVTSDLDITVGKDEVFFMGDNRNNSTDSRIIGCVTFDHVIGKVFLKVW